MKCPFCDSSEVVTDVKSWDKDLKEHIILTETKTGGFHYHGSMNQRDALRLLIKAFKELGFEIKKVPKGVPTITIELEYKTPSMYE
jgi:hypothetical protein